MGIIFQQEWWHWSAILSCAFSLVAIVPWWRAVPSGARFGAFFDVVMIVVIILYRKIEI